MNYKTGFNVKPKETNAVGEVTFTDGTYDFPPNQKQCEAYGYTYNRATGTCTAFQYNNNVATLLNDRTNNVKGGIAQVGTFNSFINGASNEAKGDNRNVFITGQEGEIPIGINNGSILGGKMGKVVRQGEIVQGGGSYNIGAGYTQSSKMQLSTKTTDATATNLEALDIDDAYITLQTNSIVGYEIYITRLETGGTSGTAGNYSYRVQRGVARTDDSGTIGITTYGTKTIGKTGVNGTFSVIDSTTGGIPSITIQVSDRANVNNLWSATVYLHELRTNIAF